MDASLPPRLRSHLTQRRQAHYQKMEAQLARWRAATATMEADMTGASVKNQNALQRQLTDLKAKLEQVEVRLNKMKETTGEAWVALQTDIAKLQEDISDSMNKAQKEFQLTSK